MLKQQVYTLVRVKDETLERNGQIGTFVGPAEALDESAVKFEADHPDGEQVIEHFKDTSLEAV